MGGARIAARTAGRGGFRSYAAEAIFLFLDSDEPKPASRIVSVGFGGTERQAGPGIEQSQIFADDVERVGSGVPPALRLEGVVGGGAHDGFAASARELSPKSADAARVSFGSDDDYGS